MYNNIKLLCCLAVVAGLLFTACDQSSLTSTPDENSSPGNMLSSNNSGNDSRNIDLGDIDSMDDINPMLAQQGLSVRLAYAETVTKANGAETAEGQTIFANDRTKRLTAQWVPGDERRDAEGNNLDYVIWDVFEPANFGTADQVSSTPAIDASFDTYNNIKKKAKLNILKQPNTLNNPSAILGGDPFIADISEVGFLPGFFFETFVGTGSSQNVLGVAFTFVFIDENGDPTDINNDGFDDIAIKEVWYNDDFLWTDQGDAGIGTDIETVALHENGHALGFGHFGKISITNSNNKLHVSPRAVMNAIILGTQRDLLGTDKASYNSLYGNWPK